MTLRLVNPDDLPTPATYTHVVVAAGGSMVSPHRPPVAACLTSWSSETLAARGTRVQPTGRLADRAGRSCPC
jgi:hypothetical protein